MSEDTDDLDQGSDVPKDGKAEHSALNPGLETPSSWEKEPLARRDLIRLGTNKVAGMAADHIEKKIDTITGHKQKFIRPPGAIPESEFLDKCSQCGECAKACPNDAIKIAGAKEGLMQNGLPYMEIENRACYLCSNLPCIVACKDEALIPVRVDEIFLGRVKIKKDICYAYKDQSCVSCDYACPIPGALEFIENKPVINPKLCTGCGLCIQSCVHRPEKAIEYIPRNHRFPSFRLHTPLEI